MRTFLKIIGIGSAALVAAVYLNTKVSAMLEPDVIERIVPVHIEKPKPSLKELIREVPPKYGISPILAAAIVERESGGKMNSIRFEPSQLARARKITNDENQARMLASSHCAAQIMGWWAPKYNMSWSEFYDPETCIEVSMAILKDCMERHHGKSKIGQIHSALACYNGSTQYADAVMKRLGELLIEKTL